MSHERLRPRSAMERPFTSFRGRGGILDSLRGIERDSGTNAWFQELAQDAEAEGDAAFLRPRVPLFERSACSHVFSAEERRRMDKYESIDYSAGQSLTYKAQMLHRKKERRWLKWVMFIAVGVCVGLWSVLLFQTLDFMSDQKLSLLERFIGTNVETRAETSHNISSNSNSVNDEGNSLESTTRHGKSWVMIGKGYLFYILWSVLAAVLSSLCCVVMPSAAGSGVPDVMAYLNGIMFPRIFNIRNLIIKTLSCILAVSSGLPVGAEGPIIHIGSLIGAGLPTGRSRTLRCSASSLLSTFQNPRDLRDFISAGAACGMTSAFSAPIGGMLFVMEEMATFFPVRLACLVFVSCLSCICVIQIINTHLTGWVISIHAPDSSSAPGDFRPYAISMFIVDIMKGNRLSLNLLTFIPTMVGAVVLALLSVSYIISSIRISRWRSRRLFPRTSLRVLEPCICALLYATVCYVLPLALPCEEVPAYVKEHKNELNIQLFTAFCSDRENTFSPLGTLTLTSPYNALRILFSRNTSALIPWYACMLHLILYTLGSSYAGGMFISCGTVIPSLFIGALGGRFIGILFQNNVWADPGVIALIGSASYFAGISRLSFSLIVIMMELTSDLTHITCLMVGVILARAVADRFCHSLYHSLLEVKAAPVLEVRASFHKLDMFCAKHIMTAPPVTLESIENLAHVVEVLTSTPHNGFPVVSVAGRTYDGVISRSQLELLLWFIYFRDVEGAGNGETDSSSCSCPPGDRFDEEGDNDDKRCSAQQKHTRPGYAGDVNTSSSPAPCTITPTCASFSHEKNKKNDNWAGGESPRQRLEEKPHATHRELQEVRERVFWRRLPPLPPVEDFPPCTLQCNIDLTPYVDRGAHYVRDVASVSQAHRLLRHLGLRQLSVVDIKHRVVGVITRKNFVGDRLHERLRAAAEVVKQTAREGDGHAFPK